MKQQDLDRLKQICEKEGFQLIVDIHEDAKIIATIKKKNIWKNVEFAECVNSNSLDYYKQGKVYRVEVVGGKLTVFNADIGGKITGIIDFDYSVKKNYGNTFKPSTEEAYVQQLKKEAFERFGEIKVGDKFEADWYDNFHGVSCKESNPENWTYAKHADTLYLAFPGEGGAPIYWKGKWAKRVVEMIRVEPDGGNVDSGHFYFILSESAKDECKKIGYWEVNKYLAQKLEEYLNNEG